MPEHPAAGLTLHKARFRIILACQCEKLGAREQGVKSRDCLTQQERPALPMALQEMRVADAAQGPRCLL
jgi:hypothetical protein